MSRANRYHALWLAPMLLISAIVLAAEEAPDPDVVRLNERLASVDVDAGASGVAGLERLQARQAIDAFVASKPKAKNRAHLLFIAEQRAEIAQTAIRIAALREQLLGLARERDQILLEASRRDAEQARQEAERLRSQNLARVEEAQRAQSMSEQSAAAAQAALVEAEQSRQLASARALEANLAKQEAELASAAADSMRMQLESLTARRDARGEVMTLSGDVFAPGQAALRAEARANLARVVAFVQGNPAASVRIEGHTDDRGSDNLNQVLSQKRAEAVRKALIEEGVDGSRLQAVGMGENQPVAGNATEQGRARNRRVEVVLLIKQ
ncbi:MAG: OmpA family protein [Xanthomonadaceae bacterium]|nr:OmpA family protein [Xanthomonadaceae bacterium]MDP2186306.1 OmpA family protein [Xanthomonadales bacterium]MDZ4115807.1 OmpA family protein [Xanthomonadaceae bacterium]MDZ4379219.1 OmpA family protein [Xanthomonadaceae bacterium]